MGRSVRSIEKTKKPRSVKAPAVISEHMILIKRPEVIKKMVEARKKGYPLKYCAFSIGVTLRALQKWIEIGDSDFMMGKDTPYSRLSYQMRTAYAEFVGHNVANIQATADDGNWQASAWLLERIAPEDFSQSSRALQEEKDDSSTMIWETGEVKGSEVPTVIDADFEVSGNNSETDNNNGTEN